MLAFEITSPDGTKQRCNVAEHDATIGRDPTNSITLDDTKVSHFHAVVVLRDAGDYVLRDVGSSNGLTVNGEAKFRHVLRPGDRIGISPYTLTFLGVAEASSPDSTSALRLPRRPPPRRATPPIDEGPPTTLDPMLALRQLPTVATPQGINWAAMTENRALHVLQSAQVIASTASIQVMLTRLLDSVLASLEAAKGFVLLADGDGLTWRVGRPDAQRLTPLSAAASAAVYGAIESREPTLSPAGDPSGDDTLCIPLDTGAEAAGIVGIEGRFQGTSPAPGLDMATALCALCATHVANARERDCLQQQCFRLHQAVEASHRMVGCSEAFRSLRGQVHQAAQCDLSLLILGETGTGKDLAAEAIHRLSARRDGPFVEVNCAAVPETLLESEMFGHEAGAFTGATVARPGKFEAANGGTLFLNEIGDMSPALQARLLTALDKKCIVRVGSNNPIHVDVRVLAATNMDLQAMMQSGKFRPELYRRIKCLEITVPPLRRRPSDILLLASYFLELRAPRPLNEMLRLSNEAAKRLLTYSWPMNIGELCNAVLAAAIRSRSDQIDPEHFDEDIGGTRTRPVVKSLDQVEKEHIWHVLRITGGNKREAARLLGISHTTIHEKIKRHGTEPPEVGTQGG